jgi:hypothetical protein
MRLICAHCHKYDAAPLSSCPECEEYRKTAFQVPLEALPEDDGPMLFLRR